MPPMKIQPIDVDHQAAVASAVAAASRAEPAKPPVLKSRLKRLFDRQFPSVLKIASVDKPAAGEQQPPFPAARDAEFEPTSVCLANMVQSYMEETNDKPFRGRHRCNCFNPNGNDSSDDEFDSFSSSDALVGNGDAVDFLKSLVPCTSIAERNLLADTAMIVEKNKNQKQQKSDLRKTVAVGLSSLGYDSSICKSKWEKSPSYPAGEYEYIDVIAEGGERMLIDVEFRSEFEIARSTGAYKAVLQSLPLIFVGKPDRLGQIVAIVSEAARMSLKKKGMHFPPWRKAEYMRAKWLSPYARQNGGVLVAGEITAAPAVGEGEDSKGELELIFGEEMEMDSNIGNNSNSSNKEKKEAGSLTWQPPAVKPKGNGGVQRGTRVVTGLASLLKEKA